MLKMLYVAVALYATYRLHSMGYKNWYSHTLLLAEYHKVDIENRDSNYLKYVKIMINAEYKLKYIENLKKDDNSRILKMYSNIKQEFAIESYLTCVKEKKYRNALSRLRCSSHMLEVERGRHARPKVEYENRLCPKCNVVEDEIHFITQCSLYNKNRNEMFDKLTQVYPYIVALSNQDFFKFLFLNKDPLVLNALGKFTFRAFGIRGKIM